MSEQTFNYYMKGNCHNANYNYLTCRDAAVSDSASTACAVGQIFFGNYNPVRYECIRGFISFETSSLPDNIIITSAVINATIIWDYSEYEFNVILRSASNVSDVIVEEDYDLTQYDSENLAETSGYNQFILNSNGIAHINKTGVTKFVILSKNDIDSEPPPGPFAFPTNEWVQYSSMSLVITYFNLEAPPVVETIDDECEDRQSTTLTAVGEITDTGGGYTYRGFEYYQYTEEGEYDSSMWAVREIGRFAETGEFRMTLYGLKPLTCYWIRAFAGNVFGISYGEWVICCTIAGSSSTYDIYEEPFDGSYILYVSDDEAIAWRGYKGPFTGKQNRIYITDITNKTKGVKILKLVPTAKGTFHICVTVQQYLKG